MNKSTPKSHPGGARRGRGPCARGRNAGDVITNGVSHERAMRTREEPYSTSCRYDEWGEGPLPLTEERPCGVRTPARARRPELPCGRAPPSPVVAAPRREDGGACGQTARPRGTGSRLGRAAGGRDGLQRACVRSRSPGPGGRCRRPPGEAGTPAGTRGCHAGLPLDRARVPWSTPSPRLRTHPRCPVPRLRRRAPGTPWEARPMPGCGGAPRVNAVRVPLACPVAHTSLRHPRSPQRDTVFFA